MTRRNRPKLAALQWASRSALLLTCEHGGNRIPPAYRALFRGGAAVLASHRSRRSRERDFCLRWQAALRMLAPQLRVRRNYPYKGVADGLPTWLRHRFVDASYVGVELEINQALFTGRRRQEVEDALTESLRLVTA
jgi:predicted N-formylglutamate amidohydrolase